MPNASDSEDEKYAHSSAIVCLDFVCQIILSNQIILNLKRWYF